MEQTAPGPCLTTSLWSGVPGGNSNLKTDPNYHIDNLDLDCLNFFIKLITYEYS